MKRLIVLFILIPFLFSAQSSKKYPALLWKISGNGLKKPSYLYGTMHVSNRVAYYLSEQFFDALKSVDVVGLETNPGEWLENMESTGELDELSQLRNPNFYNNDFYKNAFTASFPEKRMLQGILSYDPDIINGLLYRQNKTKENFEESTYIDLFIYQSASKLGKQLISLENFAQSEIKARLSSLPDEDPEPTTSRNFAYGTQTIEDAYREGNLDKLDSLSKLGSSKNTQRYLINDRNVFFVNTIDSVLKTKALFSGVGAAHLPGDEGVIELLRKKGYTVEPITPKVSKKSTTIREELDQQIKPVSFQKQFIPDSLFSVNLPGKLYPIVNIGHLKYYIYADMVNGSFYTIVRLRHLGPVFNVTPEVLMRRTDSLLFENIPGKITLKKEIVSNTGVKGLEIINKTRRGDEQHYQIFFTDLELIMFKLGGKHNYASSTESKQFFNSIQFSSKSDKPVNFSSKTKGFSVNLPADYSYSKHSGASVAGIVEELYAYSKSKKQFYGVQQAVYNDFSYLEEDTFELNQLAKNILLNYKFKEATTLLTKTEQGFPCIELSAKNASGASLHGKVYIRGVHYYFVYLISEQETSFESDFFKSFKLMDFNFTNPIKEVTDKDFYFKAKDEVSDNALSRFNEAYAKAYEASRTKKDSVKKDFDFRTENKFYYSPSSNEYVNITYEKYNDYDYRDSKEIDEKITKILTSTTSMFVSHKKTGFKDGLFTYTCSLKDTATSRAIDVKVFIKNGLMHELSVPYDTTVGLKGWAKEFMESFHPIDSIVGKNIFENKFGQLLNDLASTDTLIRQKANVSVNSIGFQKAFGDEFVKFLSSPKLNLVNEDSRAQLFVNGGTIENEKIILPYKTLYKQYTDSFYLQLCLLKGLAYLKTQNSYTEFYNLLMSEVPLVGAGNTVGDVFSTLHDSLELCKKFFPGMLTLTKYDEYREAVYSLMADMLSKKIITPAVYIQQKDNILIDANLALKRYNPMAQRAPSASEQGNFDYLEKSAKELAETIKGSLEGLANNTNYKGSRYLRSLESYNRSPLVNYAWLLSPFYKTDEKTKQFFGKITKIKTQSIAMPVTIDLLKQNIVINDTLVAFYCKNKFTRAYFYSELEKEKLTDKFDKKYLTQQSLIESVLSSQKQLTSFYNYEKDKLKKDSLILVKEVKAANKYQNGKLYIYKSLKLKNEEEQWSAVFVQNSKDAITSKMEIVQAGYYVDNTKSEQENINDLLDYFSLGFRKRAQSGGGSYE
ncbi:hypothetical protein CNR22_22410 [Sphingobacteriaceae bacterium]|nr:hypothetical protein CNR22_22410 [Sphingobacteriaceae bacterium]